MASRMFQQFQGTLERGVVKLFATVTTSTSGAIASSSALGMTITKTASEAGRYTVTLSDKYVSLLAANALVEGAADAAYTTAKGSQAILRGVDIAGKVLYVQFVRTDTGADAELEDGAKFFLELTLKNSTV
jgi:hypothetical protein